MKITYQQIYLPMHTMWKSSSREKQYTKQELTEKEIKNKKTWIEPLFQVVEITQLKCYKYISNTSEEQKILEAILVGNKPPMPMEEGGAKGRWCNITSLQEFFFKFLNSVHQMSKLHQLLTLEIIVLHSEAWHNFDNKRRACWHTIRGWSSLVSK